MTISPRWICRFGRRIVPILLLGIASCAYYNTFYVAKKSYNAAEKSVRASETDKLPSDARRNYEKTIRQCKKVLDRHPGSRWSDDAVYLMAASYHGIGEYDSALIRLDQLALEFPESDLRVDGLFLEGMTQTKLRNFDSATSFFDQIIEEYPDYGRRDEILFVLAETSTTLREKTQAIGYYDELTRDYPQSPMAEKALKKVGELHFEAGDYDSASIFFERLLSVARDERKEIEAAVLLAQSLIRLDRAEEALELLGRVEPEEAQQDPTQAARRREGLADDVGAIRMQQAAALNRLGRNDEAISKLQEVTERYSASSVAVEAQFQIGYTYETELDSLAQASTAYEKASAMPGRSIFKEQASQRAAALKSIAELQQEEGSGDAALEARADAALRIAEILLLDRELAEEAKVKYREIEEQFPESRAAPRAGYALAYVQWKTEGDSLGAQQAFRDLVPRYPRSTQARDAIDLLVTQGADTSGLRALLVTPAPETTAVEVDSLLSGEWGPADSTRGVDFDSLAASEREGWERPPIDSVAVATASDSAATESEADTFRQTDSPDSVFPPVDRLPHEPRVRGETEESGSPSQPGRRTP